MHFCMTGQYTPRALNSIMENPTTNRYEAAKKLIEAAGGKLISMYSTAADGPGVLHGRVDPVGPSVADRNVIELAVRDVVPTAPGAAAIE